MRFEPGLVPVIFPASEDFSDTTYDCYKGFIAVEVGLGYYWQTTEVGGHYVISHLLSGYRLPEQFDTEHQVRSVITALASCGIDWWKSQEALRALPQWHNIRNIYEGAVSSVADASASTTDATAGT